MPGLFVFVLCIWTRARQRSGGRAQLNHPSALFPLRLDDCLHLPGFIWVLRGFCHTGCNYETSPHCCVYLRRAGAEIRWSWLAHSSFRPFFPLPVWLSSSSFSSSFFSFSSSILFTDVTTWKILGTPPGNKMLTLGHCPNYLFLRERPPFWAMGQCLEGNFFSVSLLVHIQFWAPTIDQFWPIVTRPAFELFWEAKTRRYVAFATSLFMKTVPPGPEHQGYAPSCICSCFTTHHLPTKWQTTTKSKKPPPWSTNSQWRFVEILYALNTGNVFYDIVHPIIRLLAISFSPAHNVLQWRPCTEWPSGFGCKLGDPVAKYWIYVHCGGE